MHCPARRGTSIIQSKEHVRNPYGSSEGGAQILYDHERNMSEEGRSRGASVGECSSSAQRGQVFLKE